MSFYVTLPSNSSMNFFPNNTLSNYTTKLHNQIFLDGMYEVALTEIIFPFNWYEKLQGTMKIGKLNDSNNFCLIDLSKIRVNTNKELVDWINRDFNHYKNSLPDSDRFTSNLTYNSQTLRFGAFIDKDSYIEFDMEAHDYFGTKYARNEGKGFTSIKQRANLINNINMIYIYSDICDYQYVGDSYSPLLNIVAVPNNLKYGDYIDIVYNTPHYIPVIKNVLDTIEINLRSDIGDNIHFDTGKVLIKLHFRPKAFY